VGVGRKQVLIVSVVIAAALLYLVFTGMRDTMVFYYTVSEVSAQADALRGQPLRVAGHVVPGSIVSVPASLENRFSIEEGGQRLAVVYHGVPPDTFVDESEAVVEGTLADDGVFHATFLMAKCPSKYEAEGDYARYREQGVAAPSRSGS
jgi:cytochrome c-type biogenesis protein CcmE